MNPERELKKLESRKRPMPPADLEGWIQSAIEKRERGQSLIEEGNAELAVYTAYGRRRRILTMKAMATVAGLGREFIYKLQRDHGVGAEEEGAA